MKACKDCKWWGGGRYRFDVCLNPAVCDKEPDYLRGKDRIVAVDILRARGYRGRCGEDAKLWEPRPPTLWQRLRRTCRRPWTVLHG